MGMETAFAYFEKVLGVGWDTSEPLPVSPERVMELLWPLNEVFRPRYERLKLLPYRQEFETAADAALLQYAKTCSAESWGMLSDGIWRVLLERHHQIMLVAMTNMAAGTPSLTPLPPGLTEEQERTGVMLSFFHQMKLLWPPFDMSGMQLPAGAHRQWPTIQ